MKTKIALMASMFILSVPLFSQKDSNLEENYVEVLKFGIESQVVDLLGKFVKEKEYQYNPLLLSLISETSSARVRELIYQLWTEGKFTGGEEYAKADIERLTDGSEELDKQMVLAAIRFLTESRDRESLPLLVEIMDYADSAYAEVAVRAIGKVADVEDYDISAHLLIKLKEADSVFEEDLVASIILSLGELRYRPAANYLVNILEDVDSSEIHRGYACVSIGKIGRQEDFALIKSVYVNSSSATMRSFALTGLAEFENMDATDILIQALKRDSYWKIRFNAAEQIGLLKEWPDNVDKLLMFKALNDPVKQVSTASIRSMGKSENPGSHDFLKQIFTDDKKADSVRLAALSALLENQISGTEQSLINVMVSLWDKKNDRLLEFISRDLSLQPWEDLANVYEKMLEHPNWLIKVYAIRAIRNSKVSTLGITRKLNSLDREEENKQVLKELRTN